MKSDAPIKGDDLLTIGHILILLDKVDECMRLRTKKRRASLILESGFLRARLMKLIRQKGQSAAQPNDTQRKEQ